ncbi:complexin-2 isoform X1 [Zonotrichia albicollis]|uniref:complexin-2 isoform X1 n=1 Tax=Zonotrichia albicollis TaxID=44394 RepID=UPI003D80D191
MHRRHRRYREGRSVPGVMRGEGGTAGLQGRMAEQRGEAISVPEEQLPVPEGTRPVAGRKAGPGAAARGAGRSGGGHGGGPAREAVRRRGSQHRAPPVPLRLPPPFRRRLLLRAGGGRGAPELRRASQALLSLRCSATPTRSLSPALGAEAAGSRCCTQQGGPGQQARRAVDERWAPA